MTKKQQKAWKKETREKKREAKKVKTAEKALTEAVKKATQAATLTMDSAKKDPDGALARDPMTPWIVAVSIMTGVNCSPNLLKLFEAGTCLQSLGAKMTKEHTRLQDMAGSMALVARGTDAFATVHELDIPSSSYSQQPPCPEIVQAWNTNVEICYHIMNVIKGLYGHG